jgi:DUF1009 family protein
MAQGIEVDSGAIGESRMSTIAPIGLLAGAGRFPIVFAEKARSLNMQVACVGLQHLAPPELRTICNDYVEVGIAKWGRIARSFRRMGVRNVVMAGKVHKANLFSPWRLWQLCPDWMAIRFWFFRKRRDNADDSLLLGVISQFEQCGFRLASALDFCPEILVKPGVLTRRALSRSEETDIDFGWNLAKEMGRLDVGQSVAVRERAVLAVEAIEGTDRAILRAGELCKRGGFVVVKVAKPQQDMRFDVPTVGVQTIESMRQAGGTVLAVEANKTILLDEPQTIALADRYGIAIVALDRAAA